MEHICHHLRILPGTEDEYDRRHAAAPADLLAAIRDSGISNYTGFRRGTDVWYYAECDPDAETAFAESAKSEPSIKWSREFEAIVAEIQDPGGDLLWYRRGFASENAGIAGAFQRAMLSFVIRPDRVRDYDGVLADLSPELVKALLDSGVDNYQVFRRGFHALHYGEFHPDQPASMTRLQGTDVYRYWTNALEGTLVDKVDVGDVGLREIFHLD